MARNENQARIVFEEAKTAIRLSPTFVERVQTFKKSLYCAALWARFEVPSGAAEGKRGLSALVIVGDEMHEWPDGALYTTLHQFRQPRPLLSCRPHGPGLGLPAGGQWRSLAARVRLWCPAASIALRARRDPVPYDLWARDGALLPTDGHVVDYTAIERQLRADAEIFDVRGLAIDRWNATGTAIRLNMQQGAGPWASSPSFRRCSTRSARSCRRCCPMRAGASRCGRSCRRP
ncbi:hypothetical protein LOK46_13305 [Methylobacterium sp. NMS14P]|uniref:hypothetical protein n=1 Tax=Methylobacterium sp. NMS14P TaxID=2894310 RepID=UPI0023580F3F|nr:hypothetical protein [Methylobacterium sp. NMS14P]WCS27751.1 hypothetical protein LOK46_13305 [Methylobacterium sp. NMS14P]